MLSFKKKVVPFGLSAVMALSLLPMSALAANSDISMTALGDQEAAAGASITISADEMSAFINYVNAGKNTKGVTFTLTEDVTEAVTTVIAPATLASADTNSPYVKSGKGFEGTFQGATSDEGKVISIEVNLTDDSFKLEDDDTAAPTGIGLFGYLAPSGTIKNLTVEGSVTSSTSTNNTVGAVVAYNSGTIDHVTNEATVNTTGVYNVGGVAGFNDNYYNVGALGIITNSTNTGDVTGYEKVGGIVGENAGTIASCSNAGTIHGTSTRKSGVGGIAGRNGNNDTAVETGVISTCLNTGEVNSGTGTGTDAGSWGGGIAGFQNSNSITNYSWSKTTASGWGDVSDLVGSNDNTNANATLGCTLATVEGASPAYQKIYGTWANASEDAAALSYNASPAELLTAKDEKGEPYVSPAIGWQNEKKTVYLDPKSEGDKEDVYTTLDEAVDAANGGTVIVMNTVEITSGASYYDSVTIQRGEDFTGTMFVINAPDNDYGTAYVTMTSATIDGGNGTVFEVEQGRLRLRGGLKIQNANTAVLMSSTEDKTAYGELDLNYVTFTNVATTVDVPNAENKVILDDFGSAGSPDITYSGVISLGSGAKLEVWSAILSDLKVTLTDPTSNPTIAVGEEYTLTASDLAHVTCTNGNVKLNTGRNTIYLPTNLESIGVWVSSNGSDDAAGTAIAPVATLTQAMEIIGNGTGTIYLENTVTVGNETILGSITDDEMGVIVKGSFFDVSPNMVNVTGTATISGLEFDGSGFTTAINVANGGKLTLDGETIIAASQNGVNVAAGGSLTVGFAGIGGMQYSVVVADSTSTFKLAGVGNGQALVITSPIYLGDGAYITVNAAIPCMLTVVSESDEAGTVIAKGTDTYELTDADSELVEVNGGDLTDLVDNQIVLA